METYEVLYCSATDRKGAVWGVYDNLAAAEARRRSIEETACFGYPRIRVVEGEEGDHAE